MAVLTCGYRPIELLKCLDQELRQAPKLTSVASFGQGVAAAAGVEELQAIGGTTVESLMNFLGGPVLGKSPYRGSSSFNHWPSWHG